MSEATVHLLGNPVAGGGRADGAVADVARSVRARGHNVVELTPSGRGDVVGTLKDAISAGATKVVVVGGDGLAHLATQALACSGVALGIVPAGTGNDLARGLGLPLDDTEAAIDRALSPPVALDALRTTHGWVASVATLGFSAAVNERANRLRRPRGGARYTVATLLELPRLAATPLVLDLDGTTHEVDVAMVAIANTPHFGGGMAICPEATPHDGLLDVAIVGDVGRFTLLRFFPQVFSGRHVDHPAVTMLRGTKLRIALADTPSAGAPSSGRALRGDGEPVGPLPVDIEAVRGALLVAGCAAADHLATEDPRS
jgi:diacylglycerol kinase (ATP)